MKYYVQTFERTLNEMKASGLNCNIENYLFGQKNGIFRFLVNM